MPDDLLTVLLCELGERILAMRELLAEPSLTAKAHTHAVAAVMARGLDAVEERLQRDVLAPRTGEPDDGSREPSPAIMQTLDDCGRALVALHERLGLLDLRWNVAPIGIFLHKLRDEAGEIVHPTVVLGDSLVNVDLPLTVQLEGDLAASGVSIPREHAGDPVLALPRIEARNPLAWPLLCVPLARSHLRRAANVPTHQLGVSGVEAVTAACMGGPAVFAARAAHALLYSPGRDQVWPHMLGPMADVSIACAGGLENEGRSESGFDDAGIVALFRRLLRERDEIAGRSAWKGRPGWSDDEPWAAVGLPKPVLPTAAEAATLLGKLDAATPINAIDPPLPSDFTRRLDGVSDAASFYELIDPLGERPASLATILGVGWLYKVRRSYPFFRNALRTAGRGAVSRPDVALRTTLEEYRPHMIERNELLMQSIEAAYVQGIFGRGKLDQ